MSSWCSNTLVVRGREQDVRAFEEKAEGPGHFYEQSLDDIDQLQVERLSFHQLVPLPSEVLVRPYFPPTFDCSSHTLRNLPRMSRYPKTRSRSFTAMVRKSLSGTPDLEARTKTFYDILDVDFILESAPE